MKRSGLFSLVNSHPVTLMAAGLVATCGILFTYHKVIKPVLKKRKYEEAKGYAEYLFQEESKKSNS